MAKAEKDTRGIVARVFTWVEDIVYVGLGILLAISALLLLGSGAVAFARAVSDGPLAVAVISLLDRLEYVYLAIFFAAGLAIWQLV